LLAQKLDYMNSGKAACIGCVLVTKTASQFAIESIHPQFISEQQKITMK